jgi:cyclopropane fatty-acyl-phospholipid synthase-like methyltransferase
MTYPRLAFDRCRLIADIVRGGDVLDMGCIDHSIESRKRGRWLHDHVRKAARSVLGLDYEQAEVEKLIREGYNAVAADATRFDLGKKFDVVVAGELIEHLLNVGGFLTSVRAHLRPEGRLVLTTPNAICLAYFLENLLVGRELDNLDHSGLYTPTTLRTLLGKHGFEIEAVVHVAESTAWTHDSTFIRFLVHIKLALEVVFGLIRPSLCQRLVVIARLKRS